MTDVAGVGFVAEDQPIPIFRSTTSDVTMPLGCEIAAAFVVSNRLLAQSNAEAVFTTLLRRTIALTLDAECSARQPRSAVRRRRADLAGCSTGLMQYQPPPRCQRILRTWRIA